MKQARAGLGGGGFEGLRKSPGGSLKGTVHEALRGLAGTAATGLLGESAGKAMSGMASVVPASVRGGATARLPSGISLMQNLS